MKQRHVILSAHSLGSVLAIAVLFALDEPSQPGRRDGVYSDRTSLLTYGSQLRAYFGRMFPELLGPAVIGSAPCLCSSLTSADPWRRDIASGAVAPTTSGLETLLGGRQSLRWVNLWRRTDYIGFPAHDYPNTGQVAIIEKLAEEVDVSRRLATVATHGDYPRSPAYQAALDELIGHPDGGT